MHFSDGSGAQYKNRNKFIKIYHEQDFGKGSAYRLEGKMKKLAAKTNVQTVYSSQIQTPHGLFRYCSSSIHNITLIYVQGDQILYCKKEPAELFDIKLAVPGAWVYHFNKPGQSL
jgi:hypothetical protein